MPYSPMQLAEAFVKTGELADALDALNQQLDEYPQDKDARRLRIDVFLRLGGDGDDYLHYALADITALGAMIVDDYQRLSVLEERLGNVDKAIAAMVKARQLSPDNERLTERLLNLLMSQKKYDEALKLVQEQEQSWRWLQYEGDLWVLIGDDAQAVIVYQAVLAQLEKYHGVMRADYLQATKARVILALAHALRRLKQISSAREHYQLAQTLLPKDPTIAFNLGLLDALSDNLERSISRCNAALENAPILLRDEMLNSIRDNATYRVLWAKLSDE
ncbi:MAG: tetratricopeptide repeat protein [Anaerolineae bacterium]|nr:tetratricopeptide repeat protein [Anaerolineae bacterium]MDQ7036461.1 tetratricopeptide repeat protein [Anaerolineae bacterium]